MRWSFRVARVLGVDVRAHVTFALAVVWCALALAEGRGWRGAAFGALLWIAIGLCMVLHALSHGFVAQRLGSAMKEIMLLPIGGFARSASEPRKPMHELGMALAGLGMGLLIAIGLGVLLHQSGGTVHVNDVTELTEISGVNLVRALFCANALLSLFNLMPALPMNGGRVLRALLSRNIGSSRATRLAAGAGQIFGIVMIAYAVEQPSGILSPLSALAGLLVFVGAAKERSAGRDNELLRELRAGEVCDPGAMVFAPHEQIGHVLDTLIRCPQSHFAVFYGKELVGTVARDRALTLAPRVGLDAPLSSVMRREITSVDAGTPLDEVRRRLLGLAGRPVVVRSPAGYAGVLGFEDLRRITVVAERLARAGIRRPQPVPDPALH